MSTALDQPEAGAPTRGGTLTIAMTGDAQNFDPPRASHVASGVVLSLVVDSLFELDGAGNVVGRLVERSENPEPNVCVWRLRAGVTFGDGSPLGSAAVKFNLERHRQDRSSVRLQSVKDILSIDTPDPLTVRVLLGHPSALLLNSPVGGAGYILNPAAVERLGDDLRGDLTGAGSGPFRFTSWQRGSRLVLDRNPSYWKKAADGSPLPYLDRVVLLPLPDDDVRIAALLTGQVDAFIGNSRFSLLPRLKQLPSLVVEEMPGTGFMYIALNTRTGPLASPGVRRALSLALDRDQLQQDYYFGVGAAIDAPLSSVNSWAATESHPYLSRDVPRALAAPAAAGYADGFTLTYQDQDTSAGRERAELLQRQWRDISVTLEIQFRPFATIVNNGFTGQFEALTLGWTGGTDPDSDLHGLYYSSTAFNFAGYANPRLDALLDEGRTIGERELRAPIYREALQIIYEDQPYPVFYSSPRVVVHHQAVRDFPRSYNGYWGVRDFDRVWKTAR